MYALVDSESHPSVEKCLMASSFFFFPHSLICGIFGRHFVLNIENQENYLKNGENLDNEEYKKNMDNPQNWMTQKIWEMWQVSVI